MYGDLYSFSALIISTNKEEYKITLRYFFYWLNMIGRGIFLDEVEQLFLYLEVSFMRRLGNDNLKIRCLLAFLKEAEYINKVMYAWVEYYASK